MSERVPALPSALSDLVQWADAAQVPATAIGGVAASILGRPRLTQDIEGLLDAHPDANLEIVTRWVREFATAVTMPDIAAEWEKLLARRERG